MSWAVSRISTLRQTLSPLGYTSLFDRWVILTLIVVASPFLYLLWKILFALFAYFTKARTHIGHNDMLEQIKDTIIMVDDGMGVEEIEQIDWPDGVLLDQATLALEEWKNPAASDEAGERVKEPRNEWRGRWENESDEVLSDIVASSSHQEGWPIVQIDPDVAVRESLYREKFRTDANYLKHRGKMEDYEKKLIEWLAMEPQSVEITRALADYYFASAQSKKALPLLKRVVEYHPDDHKSLRQIAEMYLDAGDFETAEVLVNKACNLDHDNPKYATTMVEIYYNTGRIDDAIALMEQVVKRRPSHIGYREALAKLYEEVQQKELAQHCYYAILEIDPQHAKAKKKLAR